jgi:hypothetical protein
MSHVSCQNINLSFVSYTNLLSSSVNNLSSKSLVYLTTIIMAGKPELCGEPWKSGSAAAYNQKDRRDHDSEESDEESGPDDVADVFEGRKKKSKKACDNFLKACINSRYPVFDRSGNAAFSVVFGLRRADGHKNPEPLVLDTRDSILDVPYALANGLLTLHEYDEKTNRSTPVEVNQLARATSQQEDYVTLPSSVNRASGRRGWTVYEHVVEPASDLGLLFEVGKQYEIRFSSTRDLDLGVKWYGYGKQEELLNDPKQPRAASETPKLLLSAVSGLARFKAVQSIAKPPDLIMHMRLCPSIEASGSGGVTLVEVVIVNNGLETITVQTSGEQSFLIPQGPQGVDFDVHGDWTYDSRPRIIDSAASAPLFSVQIVDITTSKVVRDPRKPSGSKPLTKPGSSAHLDHRPKLPQLVTLKPGEPAIRTFGIDECLKWRVDNTKPITTLADGRYGVRLEPRGMWWCTGDRNEFATKEAERLPKKLWNTYVLPVLLHCEDTIEVTVKDGRLVPSL